VKHLHMPKRTLARVAVIGLALSAATCGPTLLIAGDAQAAACGTATPAGTSCTLTGTLSLTSGTMTLTSPSALAWSGTVNGLDQQLVDTTAAHQSYLVNDSTGSAPGWHVTASATQFTTGGGTPSTLANTGTFVTNGSVSSIVSATAPTATCLSGSTCTLPTDTTTYPVALTTAATTPTAFNIYDASAATGLGSITIGGSTATNPVGWWLNVPSNTLAGTYTSTVTLEIISGP
jgi:hypothetical protein